MTVAKAQFFVWEPNQATATVSGHWTLANYGQLQLLIKQFNRRSQSVDQPQPLKIDFSKLQALDTAGALCLFDLFGQALEPALEGSSATLSPERQALLLTVIRARATMSDAPSKPLASFWSHWLGHIGAALENHFLQAQLLLGFIGITLTALVKSVFRPSRWRVTSVVAQLEAIGFDAVPIVVLLTFMVGAVVAFLGATILADFGATIYTVTLVGFSFLREFAVILTAILLAGRTASAFTAQIGSMKVNEELDAIRMTGLDPIDLLVMPRILAMLIALPLLTFIGMVSGVLGGMLVCAFALDISPLMFLSVFKQDIALRHFFLGLAKAPVFAYVIALIGCLEGFKVQGSALSVGKHTTSAVVQSIFMVILIDAVAALFYMEMGW